MKKIVINTKLLGRAEVFKVLAVAHCTGYPTLLVGPPGVGKTNVLLDYSKAVQAADGITDPMEQLANTFILETDEGTRSAEVKGRPNMKKLLDPTNPTYEVNTPIADAKVVLINEIDKANAAMRNSFLSVMNEKFLFNGEKKIMCNWELFCSACNIIPKDEENSPFWDRFILKYKVSRLTKSQLLQFYKMTSKAPVEINLPDEQEINAFITDNLNEVLMRKFVELTYNELSDRTLTYVPRLIAGVAYCFDVPVKKAMIKTCELLTTADIAKALSTQIEAQEIATMRNKIDMIKTLGSYDQITSQIDEVKKAAKSASQNPEVTRKDLEEIANELNKALAENPVYSKAQQNLGESLNAPSDKVSWNKITSKV
jgi:hypothetical protein